MKLCKFFKIMSGANVLIQELSCRLLKDLISAVFAKVKLPEVKWTEDTVLDNEAVEPLPTEESLNSTPKPKERTRQRSISHKAQGDANVEQSQTLQTTTPQEHQTLLDVGKTELNEVVDIENIVDESDLPTIDNQNDVNVEKVNVEAELLDTEIGNVELTVESDIPAVVNNLSNEKHEDLEDTEDIEREVVIESQMYLSEESDGNEDVEETTNIIQETPVEQTVNTETDAQSQSDDSFVLDSPHSVKDSAVSFKLFQLHSLRMPYTSFEPDKQQTILNEVGQLPSVRDISAQFQNNVEQNSENNKQPTLISPISPTRKIASRPAPADTTSNDKSPVHKKVDFKLSPLKIESPVDEVEKVPIVKTPYPATCSWERQNLSTSSAEAAISTEPTVVLEEQKRVSELLQKFRQQALTRAHHLEHQINATQMKPSQQNGISKVEVNVTNGSKTETNGKVKEKQSVQNQSKENGARVIIGDNVWLNSEEKSNRSVRPSLLIAEKKVSEDSSSYTRDTYKNDVIDWNPTLKSSSPTHWSPTTPTSQQTRMGLRSVRDFYNVWGKKQ